MNNVNYEYKWLDVNEKKKGSNNSEYNSIDNNFNQ